MNKVFVIAEAGVNHNGQLELAKRLVDAAAAAGADAIKFQTFVSEKVVSRFAEKADYQKKNTGKSGSQLDMLKRCELNPNAHQELVGYCKERKILFLSTPFDLKSIDLLDRLGLPTLKISSGEITNLPYLRKIGALKKKIILSTGMADLGEIEDALDVLLKEGTPKKDITILHCNTEYPTPMEDVNLLAMITIRDAFKVDVGYSDHTLGIEIPIAAAALGAKMIEKHFTLDRNMEGPDHKGSLDPADLSRMIKAIRHVEKAIGDGCKRPSSSEMKNRAAVRKSIVALENIKKGEPFSDKNISAKRPGTGISPMDWDRVVGRIAARDFEADAMIEI